MRDTFGSAPSRPNVLASLPHVTRAFLIFHLAESQNRSRHNELRDRILSPEDLCPRSLYPRFLGSSRQGEVHPLSVPPTAWHASRQPSCYPALERVQGSLHPLGEDPGLRPEEEDLLCHGNIKIA